MAYGLFVQDVVIAAGQSLSGDVDLDGGTKQLVALQMPDGWDAASVTFAGSYDGTTFVPIYFSGAEYEITAAGGATASAGISVDPEALSGWPYIRVRSGTSGTPVNQTVERTIRALRT